MLPRERAFGWQGPALTLAADRAAHAAVDLAQVVVVLLSCGRADVNARDVVEWEVGEVERSAECDR